MSVLSNLINNYADDVVRSTVSNYGDDVARAATNNIDDVLRGLGVSQNKNGQFIANGTRSYDADKSFWQKLQEIIGGEHTDPDYFMSHRPSQTGVYADDLTKVGFDDIALPKDIYDNPQYYTYMYGETPDVMNETMAQLNAVRGNPNGQVNIYRATTGDAFNDGDWITLSPTYAKNHLRDQLGGNGRVISQKVNVRDIQHAGDDLAEWGFYPQQRVLPDNTQSMLKKLLTGNDADQIYPRVNDDYFNMFTNQQFKTPYETPEDLAKVAAFKNIIESGGEITPIAVRSAGNGQYAIDDGLHRMRAYYETGRQPLFRVFDNKTDSYNFADLWNKSNGNPI